MLKQTQGPDSINVEGMQAFAYTACNACQMFLLCARCDRHAKRLPNAHLTISLDAWTAVAMSASLNSVFWKVPIDFPNC